MMISRALLIALLFAYTTSLTPLAAPGDDDCALYLTGPGRSSAYDYSINLLKGNFAYDGQHTCITYEAINQAYLDARTRILVSHPKGDWHAEDFASVGELILDISTSLARTYGLTYEEIEKGLPLIDTSRTLIREVCPPVFSHVECRAGKYRRLDGLCNNLQHPTWGATMAPFQRLIGPLFADGINAPRIAHTGRDLPLSRVVSRTMHTDEGYHDHAGTVMVIAWGQFMDHDYTLTGTPLDPINRNDPEECCKRPPHLKHPYCNEIRIPDDDYFYRLFGVKCIDFVRGFPSPRPGCKLGSRVPFNTLTGAIDGNTVYGVTEKFARKLRTGYGGLLRMNPVFKEYGLKDLLPLKLDIPDEGCTRPNKNMFCFEAGEIRVNEQLVLTVMHTLMAREHNRVATALAEVNPHWDDETLFQEARRINIAEIQHITYNEFLPILLGKDVMDKFGLVLEKDGYWNGYDPEVNPDVIASFAAAAYRFGHSLLPTAVERWSKAHKFIASKRLSDLIRRPYDLYRAGVLDEYVMGLMNQVAQAMDDSITQEVTNHLFKKVGARFGMDLVSFNMQRGREFGLPGYMEFRKFCGLSDANSFQDLFGSMANETLRKYESIFEHPIDVDLWSGGVSEKPLRGSMLGPTFACIIATQFSYSRRGDRFWFELPNQPSSFTPEQLKEIRKSRLARIICDNTDIIDTVQLYPMVLPDHELNPRVPCRSGIIPAMDFSKWAEPVPFAGTAKQYITDAVIQDKLISNHTTDNACINSTVCKENQNNNLNTTDKFNEIESDTNNVKSKDLTTTSPLIECDNITEKLSFEELKTMKNKNLKDNNAQRSKKTKGHKSNSLRKKRFAPAIYSYITNHDNVNNEKLVQEGTVKSESLADYHIETTHEPFQIYTNENDTVRNVKKEELRNIPVVEPGSYELDHLNIKNNNIQKSHNQKSSQEIDESSENANTSESSENITRNDKTNTYPINTKFEHFEKDGPTREIHDDFRLKDSNSYNDNQHIYSPKDSSENDKELRNSEESLEVEKNSPYSKQNSKPIYDDDNYNKNKLNHHNSQDSEEDNSRVHDSSENNDSKQNIKHNPYNKLYSEENIGNKYNSNESGGNSRHIENYDDASEDNNKIKSNSFNTNESVEEDRTAQGNESPTSENKDKSEELFNKNEENDSYEVIQNDNEDIVNINDAETKPVIEKNNEDISAESKESIEAPLDDYMKKSNLRLGNSEKKISPESQKVDVKQQFERIPLDYKHVDVDSNKQNETSKLNVTPNVDSKDDETLLSKLLPKSEEFDENSNIKLGDVSIKLPDIKLPDDILAYNYDETPFKNNKPKFSYNKNKKVNSDNSNDKFRKNNDAYDYHSNFRENYKTKEPQGSYESDDQEEDQDRDDNDDEDLYEKFVRERFGKRSSLQKSPKDIRKAKYEYITPSKELYNTLQNVLKKTEKIQEEAEKSGDPNAEYAWTLEYGQKL